MRRHVPTLRNERRERKGQRPNGTLGESLPESSGLASHIRRLGARFASTQSDENILGRVGGHHTLAGFGRVVLPLRVIKTFYLWAGRWAYLVAVA